jgi:hypothetical protein
MFCGDKEAEIQCQKYNQIYFSVTPTQLSNCGFCMNVALGVCKLFELKKYYFRLDPFNQFSIWFWNMTPAALTTPTRKLLDEAEMEYELKIQHSKECITAGLFLLQVLKSYATLIPQLSESELYNSICLGLENRKLETIKTALQKAPKEVFFTIY